MTGRDVLPENELLEKAATLKRFEYSPLGKAFEKQTNVITKQTEVINKKEDKRNKFLKTMIETDENIVIRWKMIYFICPKNR